MKVPHDVSFTLAPGARAMAAQFFQRDKTLGSIRPPDRKLFTNLLNIFWSHSIGMHGIRPGLRWPVNYLPRRPCEIYGLACGKIFSLITAP